MKKILLASILASSVVLCGAPEKAEAGPFDINIGVGGGRKVRVNTNGSGSVEVQNRGSGAVRVNGQGDVDVRNHRNSVRVQGDRNSQPAERATPISPKRNEGAEVINVRDNYQEITLREGSNTTVKARNSSLIITGSANFLKIDGENNYIQLQDAKILNLQGSSNVIVADSLQRIIFNGSNNTINYLNIDQPDPQFTQTGRSKNNTILRDSIECND